MMHVLWLTQNHPPRRGGMAQSGDRIVTALRARGVAVDVAHLRKRGGRLGTEREQGGRLFTCPVGTEPSHALHLLWNLIAAEGGEHPYTHVLAFGGVLPLVAGPVIAAWLGCPLVTLLRGNDFDSAVFSPKRQPVLREAIARSACVCTVTREMAARIDAAFPGTPVEWTPNGIDLDDWQALPSDDRRAHAMREAMSDGGRRIIGLFGEIKRKKGAMLLLEAALASGLGDRLHLHVVGECEPAIERWLETRGRGVAYSLWPFLDRYELMAHYRACHLVAIPSYYDGLPNVLLEAAALGVPLLASRAGGMADFLEDGMHGLLFAPGDLHDCRHAVHRAIECRDDALDRMGARCRALVEGSLRHDAEAERYLAVLRRTARHDQPIVREA